uniref:Uncharacterized protein n=1 Tax=Cuerna arida TaxID=1464854 RepID=A0A1B6EJ35_9HEMI
MLRSFCGCLRLKVGCILFCIVFMVFQVRNLRDCFAVLKYLGPEKNEDEENKKQKVEAKSHYTIKAVVAAFLLAAAMVTLIAVFMKQTTILRIGSVIVFLSAFMPFLLSALNDHPSTDFTIDVIILGVCMYGSCLLWSYAVEIEEPEIPIPVTYIESAMPPPQYQYQGYYRPT